MKEDRLSDRLNAAGRRMHVPAGKVFGRLQRVKGLCLEASGCRLSTGQRCLIERSGSTPLEAEVVGFDGSKLFLMPLEQPTNLRSGDWVRPIHTDTRIPVGNALLGRVIDGVGRPLDGNGALKTDDTVPLEGEPINPLKRRPISEPLNVGIRAINSLLTVGKGQRLGLFAGSGVGKSVLLGMMTRYTSAEITVVGLVGERGREVQEFIEQNLGEEGMKRAVVVAAPADSSPVMRLRASRLCHRIAEYFRDQGKDVLLLMDSLTRFAQAQREVALAVGEPPATKGYPPSVFSLLPTLVERAGNGENGNGSVTAFYTVLSEGDDQQDPIADSARAILDGHFVLSRELAESGHYPAIDVEQSISRVMTQVTSDEHQKQARQFRQTLACYNRNSEMVALGAYRKGTDPSIDHAIQMYPAMADMLQQRFQEASDFQQSLARLQHLWGVPEAGSQLA